MQILHITHSLLINSGISVFVAELAKAQEKLRHKVVIWCWAAPEYNIGEVPLYLNEYRSAKIEEDIVHIHAVWVKSSIKWMLRCLLEHKPYIVSPHGCLMPRVFSKGRLKKWAVWYLLLKPLMKRAVAIHCTSEAEKEECQKLGLPGPFVVAPLGVNLPEIYGNDGRGGRPGHPQRNVLFLGRLGEEKGLVNLLDAWHQLQQEGIIHCQPQPSTSTLTYKLILAGPDWLGYKAKLDAKIAAEHIEGVEFPGLVQGEAKDKLYREADIFVLSSPMENFSMVVLDALAYGIPAIATKGTPWSELETEHCGWWIDQGVAPLKDALQKAMSLTDDDRATLGANGRSLAERKYQWSAIAKKLLECYQEVCT